MSGGSDPAVLPCAAGASRAEAAATEARPVDDAAHRDCRIRLVSVKEQDNEGGPEFIGSVDEIHVKSIDRAGKQLRIRYEVVGCTMDVTLWLELVPSNTVHANFYQRYEGNGVTGRRVVTVLDGASRTPGTHEALWSGRDQTEHNRILLDGQYLLKIQGVHDVTRSDESTLTLTAPYANNYGIHYNRRRQNGLIVAQTTKRECEHAQDRQKHLQDGTQYGSVVTLASPARDAWESIRDGALSVIAGHSTPNDLMFYPEASEPGQPVEFVRRRQSTITQHELPAQEPGRAESVDLSQEPPDALRDMLLAILAGCKAGNEVVNLQSRLRFLHQCLNPGAVDGDHGTRTTDALREYQTWWDLATTDGSKTPETLAALGVDPALDEVAQTRAVQTRLRELARRYNPGTVDGIWNDDTERALTHWQEDHHPPLEVNSLPDEPTLRSLRLDGEDGRASLNMADYFRDRGCNIVVAFVKSVLFRTAETWHMHFWDLAAQGVGVEDACNQARDLCPARMRSGLQFTLYTRFNVSRNETLHPARHGANL